VILAAGESKRMGLPKVLLPVGGKPMIRRVAECLLDAGLGEVIVVTGASSSEIGAALRGLGIRIVPYNGPVVGMGHSIACSVGAVSESASGFLIALGDMPDVLPRTVQSLVETQSPGRIVVPRFQGQPGHPVVFGSQFRCDLEGLDGDEGAKRILQANLERVVWMDVDDAGILRDYDEPSDLDDELR